MVCKSSYEGRSPLHLAMCTNAEYRAMEWVNAHCQRRSFSWKGKQTWWDVLKYQALSLPRVTCWRVWIFKMLWCLTLALQRHLKKVTLDPLPGDELSSACPRELMVYIQVLPRDRPDNKSMQPVIKSKCLLILCHYLKENMKDCADLWNFGQLNQNTGKTISRLIKSLLNTTDRKQQLKKTVWLLASLSCKVTTQDRNSIVTHYSSVKTAWEWSSYQKTSTVFTDEHKITSLCAYSGSERKPIWTCPDQIQSTNV